MKKKYVGRHRKKTQKELRREIKRQNRQPTIGVEQLIREGYYP